MTALAASPLGPARCCRVPGRPPPLRSPLRLARSAPATASPSLPARAGGGACAPGRPLPTWSRPLPRRLNLRPRPPRHDSRPFPVPRGRGTSARSGMHDTPSPGSWGALTTPPTLRPIQGSPGCTAQGVGAHHAPCLFGTGKDNSTQAVLSAARALPAPADMRTRFPAETARPVNPQSCCPFFLLDDRASSFKMLRPPSCHQPGPGSSQSAWPCAQHPQTAPLSPLVKANTAQRMPEAQFNLRAFAPAGAEPGRLFPYPASIPSLASFNSVPNGKVSGVFSWLPLPTGQLPAIPRHALCFSSWPCTLSMLHAPVSYVSTDPCLPLHGELQGRPHR